jgi:1-aminocyclopropane-1-carboxylate deaminase/D-cysteine desulfhydrase-like pyridoxal-dependent ACC family enzyme
VRQPPRFPLALLPTPLVPAPRLGEALGREIWIKRDDLTGFALGGNKVRTLEVLVADALDQGCDHMVGSGGPGSNLGPALAAAAGTARLGCTIVLFGSEPRAIHPNLAMMRAFGARVVFTGDPDRAATSRYAEAEAERLRARGCRPYVVPRGAASGLGATGYAQAAGELAAQLTVTPAHVVVAAGSGGTAAGLLAGWSAFDLPGALVAVAVSRPVDETAGEIGRLSAEAAALLGSPEPALSRLRVIDGLGRGFALADPAICEAAQLALCAEGLLADLTYVARAVAALAALDGPVVLWHTGGWPGVVGEAMGVPH